VTLNAARADALAAAEAAMTELTALQTDYEAQLAAAKVWIQECIHPACASLHTAQQ